MRKKVAVAVLLGSITLLNICAQLYAIKQRNSSKQFSSEASLGETELMRLTAENFSYEHYYSNNPDNYQEKN